MLMSDNCTCLACAVNLLALCAYSAYLNFTRGLQRSENSSTCGKCLRKYTVLMFGIVLLNLQLFYTHLLMCDTDRLD